MLLGVAGTTAAASFVAHLLPSVAHQETAGETALGSPGMWFGPAAAAIVAFGVGWATRGSRRTRIALLALLPLGAFAVQETLERLGHAEGAAPLHAEASSSATTVILVLFCLLALGLVLRAVARAAGIVRGVGTARFAWPTPAPGGVLPYGIWTPTTRSALARASPRAPPSR